MAKRFFLMLVLVAILIGGLGFVKYKQVQAAIAMGSSYAPPPTSVTTVVAKQETWPSTTTVVGTAAAIHGVTVSADLPGTVDKIHFESGQWVHEGDVLVELDTRQERAQLANVEAQRDLAKINYGRLQELVKEGVTARSEYDTATANQKATEAQVGEIRATIARKTIHAPFSGVLGIRQANLGQYLAAGAAIVSLQALNPIYANFGVPQQSAPQMTLGHRVRVANNGTGIALDGRITALDSVVDEKTRNIQVQATLANPGNKLRPGMFVEVELPMGKPRVVFPLPASAINYAPYGDSVFVVTDVKDPKTGKSYRGVRQQVVKVDGTKGDQVAIVAGLNPGDEVVSAGVFRIRNGAPVQINNKVQPGNNPNPTPEDN
jgi:membrane fusion protein (multidrug efflux system)